MVWSEGRRAILRAAKPMPSACVGGHSKVPLGFISPTENLMMVAMAVWPTVKHGVL